MTAVKIDNVDGQGKAEIWCSDATGHLYLFGHDPTPTPRWRCIYRSGEIGAYPGCYNNLHPVKDASGRTYKLLVQSPGYLTLFSVDYTVVTPELQ